MTISRTVVVANKTDRSPLRLTSTLRQTADVLVRLEPRECGKSYCVENQKAVSFLAALVTSLCHLR